MSKHRFSANKHKDFGKSSSRQESSFRCANCRAILSEDPLGSKHRNHCPLCLWSNHVDLNTPGDRRSTCCARMQPIALAFKNYEVNPFTGRGSGEFNDNSSMRALW